MSYRLLPLLARTLAPVVPFVAGGNRNEVPNAIFATGNSDFMRYNRIAHKAPALFGSDAMAVTYANFFPNANGGESSTGLLPFDLRVGLEYPLGTVTPLTFGGQITKPLAPGEMVESDLKLISIPAGATYYLRHEMQFSGITGSYNALGNAIIAPGRGDRFARGSDANVHYYDGSTEFTGDAPLTQVFSAMQVRFRPSSKQSGVLILGDSIGRGAGDKRTSPTGQGDWISGTSPTPPYINIGDLGWLERAIAGRHGTLNLSVAGKTALAYTAALTAKQFQTADLAPPTHVVIETGVNDFLTGATAAQVATRNQAIMTLARNRWGSQCYLTTITPVSNSTDSWATLGNQSLSGTLPNGTAPDWAAFTDNTQSSGRSLYNAQVRAGSLGADGYFDPAILVQDAGDERYWATGSGPSTGDGIHPNQATHTIMTGSMDPTIFDQASTASAVLWESGDRMTWEDGSVVAWES